MDEGRAQRPYSLSAKRQLEVQPSFKIHWHRSSQVGDEGMLVWKAGTPTYRDAANGITRRTHRQWPTYRPKPETETFIVDTSSVHDEVEPIVARAKGDSETGKSAHVMALSLSRNQGDHVHSRRRIGVEG